MPNPFARATHYTPDTLEEAIDHLRKSGPFQIELGHLAITADRATAYPEDLALIGIIQRSLDLIDAFTLLVERSNATAAIPLLRVQLDSCMRFSAFFHCSERQKLLAGEPIHTLKASSGEKLSDSFLHRKLTEEFKWFSHVYEFACRFVHLSTPGMLGPVIKTGSESERLMQFHVGPGAGRQWKDSEKKEAVDAFIGATEVLCFLIETWGEVKKEGAAKRAADEESKSKEG